MFFHVGHVDDALFNYIRDEMLHSDPHLRPIASEVMSQQFMRYTSIIWSIPSTCSCMYTCTTLSHAPLCRHVTCTTLSHAPLCHIHHSVTCTTLSHIKFVDLAVWLSIARCKSANTSFGVEWSIFPALRYTHIHLYYTCTHTHTGTYPLNFVTF